MDRKHQVHNLIILDESGSMEAIKKTIIEGFNELVQTIKGIEQKFPDQEHYISFISFNGLGIKEHHFNEKASKMGMIDQSNYNPDANTPLFDAMGFSINKLKNVLKDQTNYNVLVTILTDGEENASMEFSGKAIKNLIEELKQNKWTFTYIGTDHDIEKIANEISIVNILSFKKTERDIESMFLEEGVRRYKYNRKIQANEDTVSNYFEDTESEDSKKA